MHFTTYISNLPKLAKQIHPDSTGINKLRKNVRFCLWGITNGKAIKAIRELFAHKNLAPVLKNNPKILEKPLKPYLCVNWSKAQRIKYLKEHYLFINKIFAENASTVLSAEGVSIFEFTDSQLEQYQIRLNHGASREGGLGIKLVNSKGQSIYSLACNITGTDKHIMYIGMVQGASESIFDRHTIIKTLTKALHGLRTKALIVEIALMLARIWKIDEVRAISNKGHIYQALRYIGSKRNSVSFDYDALWGEFGAERVDPYLFRLPVNPPRKEPAILKKTKRKLYTKRYQWLEDTDAVIRLNLTRNFK